MIRTGMAATMLAALMLGASAALAHPPDADGPSNARVWTNVRTGEDFEGSFLAARRGKVALETVDGGLASIAIADLGEDDRTYVEERVAAIVAINESRVAAASLALATGVPAHASGAAPRSGPKPAQAAIFDAFGPFVTTRFDEHWLYVESDGLPHPPLETRMMVGIRAWQQQVPLPQPYTGSNAWRIPLKPELAERPISGRTSLMRGAIALAANGVPIFNALNNGGRDSFLIGELDAFGGHCGRADDYHYHAAPIFLEEVLGKGVPIAYALDGLPIFGLFDPAAKAGDPLACPLGSHEPLDELNGHLCEVPMGEGLAGGTRTYHYHASRTFPYINGGLRGKVEIEGSGTDTQVVPQPRALGVRAAMPPLRGASITGFEQTGEDAWSLRYEVGGRTSAVNYRVEDGGTVVFEFVAPDGTRRIEEHRPRSRRGDGNGRVAPNARGGDARGGREVRGQRPQEERGPESPRTAPPVGLTLRSSGGDAAGMLDVRHTCDGEAVSPPFAWSGVPAGTRSLALTMHHVTPEGDERVYLVLGGIPAETDSIEAASRSIGTFGANGVNRRAEYAPPCSQGPGQKVYVATLYALSAEPSMSSSTTRAELLDAMSGITLGTATLELRHARPEGEPAATRGELRPREGRGGADRRPEEGVGEAEGRGAAPSRGLLQRMMAFNTDVPASDFDAILATPTATTMTVSVRAASDRLGAIEYRRDGSASTVTTPTMAMKAGVPTEFTMEPLDADAGHTYRFVWWAKEGDQPTRGELRRFHTPRLPGTPFTFVIQADSHLDQGVTPEVYAQTLRNMAAASPDFLVDLGDTFMTDKRGQDFERAEAQYDAQRHYFGLACHSMPLFMVLGNHDGERGDVAGSMPAWSYRERVERFPEPVIDGTFYTGATAMKDGRGANRYAFEWGDALVVVLDPFWPTTERARGGGGRPGERDAGSDGARLEPTDASWARTLGRAQYDWLAETLAASDAKQKFVFIHHLVGGIGGQAARGGVESARYFEWGGDGADGRDVFAERRPGWPMPVHDLLVQHGVTAVFHGHDHLYVHATLDGIHYQCVPQPGNLGGNTRSAAEYGYASGTLFGSPGHLRVGIAADGTAKVEFVRTAISDADAAAAGGGRARHGGQGGSPEANGTIVDSYEIQPRTAPAARNR